MDSILVNIDVVDWWSTIRDVILEHEQAGAVKREVVVSPLVAQKLRCSSFAHPAGVSQDVARLL